MTNSLAAIRDRIHRKSENYFTFSYRSRGPDKWRMFYGATDALLDASMAASAFDKAVRANSAIDLLVCYGFLQALYIQQDAVWTLSRALGLDWRPNNDSRIKEIRDLRNRLTGHPALARENEKPPRLSSAIIAYHDVKPDSFSGHIYFDGRIEQAHVNVPSVLKANEERLAIQLLAVEAEMDNRERQFRSEQAKKPFGNLFGTDFDYLIQRLRPELDNEGRVVQATTHAAMIRDRVNLLKQELTSRSLDAEYLSYELSVALDGLDLIERMIAESDRSSKSQNEIDIVCDGFVTNMDKLRNLVAELDKKLSSSV